MPTFFITTMLPNSILFSIRKYKKTSEDYIRFKICIKWTNILLLIFKHINQNISSLNRKILKMIINLNQIEKQYKIDWWNINNNMNNGIKQFKHYKMIKIKNSIKKQKMKNNNSIQYHYLLYRIRGKLKTSNRDIKKLMNLILRKHLKKINLLVIIKW